MELDSENGNTLCCDAEKLDLAQTDVIKKTFDATTQYAQSDWITGSINDTYRSSFPALNVRQCNESVVTDTIFCDPSAIDDGATCAQFFTDLQSKFCEMYGRKTDGQFVQTLMDSIRKNGSMDTLVSDRAQAEMSNKVKDVLRHLCINAWQSKPHYQQISIKLKALLFWHGDTKDIH